MRTFLILTTLIFTSLMIYIGLVGSEPDILVLEMLKSPVQHIEKVVYEPEIKEEFIARVTAYNTVSWQTDASPCISSSGDDICGRNDVAACPRRIPLGSIIRIGDNQYTCLDRLALKYDNRVDISFDKDIQAAKEWGIKTLKVKVLK